MIYLKQAGNKGGLNMKMNKKFKLFIAIMLSITLVGCKNELEVYPETEDTVKDEIQVDPLSEGTLREQVEEEVKSVANDTAKSIKAIGDIVVDSVNENLDEQTKEDLKDMSDTVKNKSKSILTKNTKDKLRDTGKILSNKVRETVDEIKDIE